MEGENSTINAENFEKRVLKAIKWYKEKQSSLKEAAAQGNVHVRSLKRYLKRKYKIMTIFFIDISLNMKEMVQLNYYLKGKNQCYQDQEQKNLQS